MQQMPTVFVVDDDDAVRDSMSLLIESVGLPVETYPSGQAFLDTYTDDYAGCLVLDIRMPGMNGLELQTALLQRQSNLPIIFITAHGDIPMAVDAMKHGAADFLTKPFRDQDLLDRIDKVLKENTKNMLKIQELKVTLQRIASLTPRESEVMHLMVEGKPSKVIAIELNISERTIEVHRARVMEKMQAGSIAELVRLVILAKQQENDEGFASL